MSRAETVQSLASFTLNALKTFASNEDALKAIVGRIATAAGGATEAEIASALDASVKGRKAAHKGMMDAGKARG
jgi:hypothetical protein